MYNYDGYVTETKMTNDKTPEYYPAQTPLEIEAVSTEDDEYSRRRDFFRSLCDDIDEMRKGDLAELKVKYKGYLDRTIRNVCLARDERSREERSAISKAIKLVEEIADVSLVDWPDDLLEYPDFCSEYVKWMLESGNGTVYRCAQAAREEFHDSGGRIVDKKDIDFENSDYERMIWRYEMCNRVLLGDDESAKSVIDEYGKYIGQYGTINIGEVYMTEEGQTEYMEYIRVVEHLGRDNVLKLHDKLGIAIFSRWSLQTLDSMVDLVNGKGEEKSWSVVLIGKSGDHNGAFKNFRRTESSDIIPIEVGSANDTQDRVATLQNMGIDTIDRLTIAGHGSANGLLLASGYTLPRDTSVLRQNPITLLINMIKAGDDGLRNINLMSCSGARRFGGEASLAECLSCLDKGLAVHAPPEDAYIDVQDGEANLRSKVPLNRAIEDLLIEMKIPGYNRIASWLEKVFWKRTKSILVTSVAGFLVSEENANMTLGGEV